MDGLESHINTWLNALGFVDGASLQAQMTAMKAEIAKLSDNPVVLPLPFVADSLMNLFSMPPVTQTVGDIWGDLDRPNIGKVKDKKNTPDTEPPKETSRKSVRD
ncbi:hypothetical protein KY289_026845 [Solanum tuberosum]|nr:hypothetical protein KY289_026845 [Solanum tuberosum]